MKKDKSQVYYINTKLIYDYMKNNGLNKTQFATLCGFSVKTLNKILNGHLNVGLEALFGLIKILKCKSVELLGV